MDTDPQGFPLTLFAALFGFHAVGTGVAGLAFWMEMSGKRNKLVVDNCIGQEGSDDQDTGPEFGLKRVVEVIED